MVNQLFSDLSNNTVETLNPDDLYLHIQNKTCPYDILITDIELGNYSGINFAKELAVINPNCIIIFISNYINLATEVYEVDHIYFILKSEAETRLPKALKKAFEVYKKQNNNYLAFTYNSMEYKIACMDIKYIEALGRYLYIHEAKQSYKCIKSLKDLSSELTDSFARCHKSYIINLAYIRSVSRKNCELSTGDNIPISQTYARTFHAAYVKYVSRKLG